jgi:AAA15 family ATPase/GTPase
MLIRFRAGNFRSFKEAQELSLVASSLMDPNRPVCKIEALGYGLLPVAAIYGANASGKTNVIKALQFMSVAVTESHRGWKPDAPIRREPFLLSEACKDQPSTFAVDFWSGETRIEYGFSLNDKEVLKEHLYAYPARGRKQMWFERRSGEPFSFGRKLTGENKPIENLTRPNSLFLSAAAQNNHQMLSPVYRWFSQLHFAYRERSAWYTETARLCMRDEFRTNIQQFFRMADPGISGIEVRQREIPADYKEKNERLMEAMRSAFKSIFDVDMPSMPGGAPELPPSVLLIHRGQSGTSRLPLEEESGGTQALFSLLGPVMTVLHKGGILCVDELDSSLHPLMALALVRAFNDQAGNQPRGQIIFNTHDTNLLDQAVLRRDEVWFTEKDEDNATQLYPLSDFKPRRYENLEHGYLQGRYGAIPFLSEAKLPNFDAGDTRGKA